MGNSILEHPKINIIYDNRHSERYDLLLNQFAEQGITDFKFWHCLIYNDVVESINASHKMIVKYAKDIGLKEICIAEDDLMFSCKGAWDYFLKNKPKEFDLYLAATYIPPITNNKVCGFHLYIISEKFYDAFLGVDKKIHIDTAMDDLKGDYHFCYPFPALQKSGFSANNKSVVDYNKVLKKEDIYDCNHL